MHAKSVHFNFNTAVLLRPVDSLSSKDVHCRALYRNLNLHPTTTVRDSHSKHRTFRSRLWPWVNKKICSPYYRVFTHESFISSSLLGLWRPFLCSRVFCGILSFDFWLHKGTFRSRLESKPHRATKGQDAILNLSTWTDSSLCPTPTNTYTKTTALLWTTRQPCQGGEIWENVFNPGLMHKLIV